MKITIRQFQNLIGMLGSCWQAQFYGAMFKFQNLIGMLGRKIKTVLPTANVLFQNLIGMLGRGENKNRFC